MSFKQSEFNHMKKIFIVGAGINGLLLGLEFNSLGFSVEIFEKDMIDHLKGPSSLEHQIIRPQYTTEFNWGLRIQNALEAWRDVFNRLGENFLVLNGVAAVSFENGDWADRVMKSVDKQNLPLRRVERDKIRNLMPGFDLEHAKGGIFADFAGVIHARSMMAAIRKKLSDDGVVFHENTEVTKVEDNKIWVKGQSGPSRSDWVVVTSGHKKLMPDHFSDLVSFQSYFAEIEIQNSAKKAFWHYTPNWVDLGGEGNLWGIPRIGEGQCKIRIGAGSLTHEIDKNTQPNTDAIKEKLFGIYRELIHDFDEYKHGELLSLCYNGYNDGQMKLVRSGQTLGLLADSGHGFKFAAQNAKYVAEAFEHEGFGMAARRVAGAF